MFEKHWQLPIPTRTSQPATQHTEINSSQETLKKSKRKQLNPEIIKEIRKTYKKSSELEIQEGLTKVWPEFPLNGFSKFWTDFERFFPAGINVEWILNGWNYFRTDSPSFERILNVFFRLELILNGFVRLELIWT